MAILTGVSETNGTWPELALSAKQPKLLAWVILLLLHALLWYYWPGLRWQASTDDKARLEIQWLKLAPAKPVEPPVAAAEAPVPQKITATRKAKAAPALAKPATSANPEPVIAIPSVPVAAHNETSAKLSPDSDPLSQASPPASLDLDKMRGSARQMAKNYQTDTIAQIQESHRRDQRMETQLGQNVAKAAKKDCLKAYSGIGLLAIIPIAVSTVVDTGCKW